MAAERGRFITFEGGEGGGKSTQLRLLAEALERADIAVLRTREPGGSPSAEEIRRLLVEGEPGRWDALAEALLVNAARRDHLVRTIWPALDAGHWVLADRFADSTLAYQGYAGGVPRHELRRLYRLVAGEFQPDLTLILDLPATLGLDRARRRGGADRFERMGLAFHEKLRAGFRAIAKREKTRCALIDARGDIETVQAEVRRLVRERLGAAI